MDELQKQGDTVIFTYDNQGKLSEGTLGTINLLLKAICLAKSKKIPNQDLIRYPIKRFCRDLAYINVN
jgi:hypothetical protein